MSKKNDFTIAVELFPSFETCLSDHSNAIDDSVRRQERHATSDRCFSSLLLCISCQASVGESDEKASFTSRNQFPDGEESSTELDGIDTFKDHMHTLFIFLIYTVMLRLYLDSPCTDF